MNENSFVVAMRVIKNGYQEIRVKETKICPKIISQLTSQDDMVIDSTELGRDNNCRNSPVYSSIAS